MNSIDIIKMALKNLFKRKLRTFLTIFSVVIGATSIIVMISLGVALDETFDKQIKEMGNITSIEIYSRDKLLTNQDIDKFKKISGVEGVTPNLDVQCRILVDNGKYAGKVSILGIDPSLAESLGYTAIEGRTLSESDVGTYNIVANPLIAYYFDKKGKGEPYSKWIYDEADITPSMKKIDLMKSSFAITTDSYYGVNKKLLDRDNINFKDNTKKDVKHKNFKINIVGVVNKKEKYGRNEIIMPIDTLEKINEEILKVNNGNSKSKTEKGYTKLILKCKTLDDVKYVLDEIKNLGKYDAYSPIEYIESSKKTSASIQILLGAIGSISLFISAIGIANTMIMSTYERTKEIGIMKVIGARVSDIKKLFLVEAILIGFIGGVIGLILSYLMSFGINKVAGVFLQEMMMGSMEEGTKVSIIPVWLSVLAVTFSSFIGLMAGYFPAKRAVKIEALKAIKSE